MGRTLDLCVVAVAACAIVPSAAAAEVLDKELSLQALVALTAIGCVSAVSWLNRWTAVLGGFVALYVLFQFVCHLSELHDEHVGPALHAEASSGYVTLSYVGPILVVACHVAAIVLAATFLRRKRETSSAASEASAT